MKRSELKRDPEKVREWNDRTRDNARRKERQEREEARKQSELPTGMPAKRLPKPKWNGKGPFVAYDDRALDPPKQRRNGRSGRPQVKVPKGTRMAVYARSHGWCIRCLFDHNIGPCDLPLTGAQLKELSNMKGEGKPRRARQLHHVLPQQLFRHLAKNAANMVGMCPQCHAEHEAGAADDAKIPLDALPDCCEMLALAEGGRALTYFERTYR